MTEQEIEKIRTAIVNELDDRISTSDINDSDMVEYTIDCETFWCDCEWQKHAEEYRKEFIAEIADEIIRKITN